VHLKEGRAGMLELDHAALVVIDVQGRLAELMFERALVYANMARAIRGCKALHVPVLWLEQNPARLGPTIAPLRHLLEPSAPIAKMSLSAWGEKRFVDALAATGRKQVLLIGIETHVCVYQTAADLLRNGYEAHVVADAVSSRSRANRDAGLRGAGSAGAGLTTVEMFLFELLRTAEHPAFREVQKILK
jgi:nicotinamidase-related amidase